MIDGDDRTARADRTARINSTNGTAHAHDHDHRTNRLIGGRYRLLDRLGAGGFGHVWRAHDETLRIDVAVKEVRLPETLTPREHAERLERAEREARNAARLRDHPNVVAVHDVVVQDGVPWTVMQLIPGRTLDARLAEGGPLRPADAVVVARALLSALGAAHAAGIVHRDVKPANVMLTPDREVVLTDFGLAVAQADTSLTVTGSVMGSMEYLAPERAEGRDGMPASDLFSLGATLYQAVEGFSPFRRETATATLKAVLLDDPPHPVLAGPLTPVITGLLVKDPQLRLGIDDALAMLDAPPPRPQPRPQSQSQSQSQPQPQPQPNSHHLTAATTPTRNIPHQPTRTAPRQRPPAAPAPTSTPTPWSKAMPWMMATAGLITAVVVGACTHQTVHNYHGTLRTLTKPAPTVLPGILIGTVLSWVIAAVAVDRLRPSGTRSAPRRSARITGYGFGGLALLLAVIGAAAYDRKTAVFNEMLSRETRGPWTQAHAAAVAWLLPLFAVIYLIVYWNVESAGRTRATEPTSPRRAARR
ncbi:MAG: serine/threonine protein kinase [Catenulispora sp.]|nr:serine/threonine protein kinase [Catenulispora sp.]